MPEYLQLPICNNEDTSLCVWVYMCVCVCMCICVCVYYMIIKKKALFKLHTPLKPRT